jgi:hypothetical protein
MIWVNSMPGLSAVPTGTKVGKGQMFTGSGILKSNILALLKRLRM